LTDNIEKHASAMLYPIGITHPHPNFSHYPRLRIDDIRDKYLKQLYDKYSNQSILINNHQYEINPFDNIKVSDIDCNCDNKILYEQIFGDISDQSHEVMAYKSCKHTIYAAAKRQMKMAPTPDPVVADDFLQYSKKIIDDEVGEELTNFSYSYQQWYNHLDRNKQMDMDLVSRYYQHDFTLTRQEIQKVERLNYEGICKVEIQSIDGKPRMVCSIPLQTKYIMGPVCWALEEIFQDKFNGYCGGLNLTQMANKVNHYAALGFTKVVEGDGSAFDNTQDITLKRVDHYLYSRVKHAIYHVDKEKFYETATQLYKTMDVTSMNADTKKKQLLFTYSILGSVFSGDCDTTLCNTLRMALYNRYVNDKAGLVFGRDYICFSKGDDFTVMYKPYVSNEFINNAYYKYFMPAIKDVTKPDTRVFGLGQVLKMLDFGDLDSLKFCSLRAWFKNESEIVLTRDPKKFYNLSKYSRKIKTMNYYQAARYLQDQGMALLVSYKGIKIFEIMAAAYFCKAKYFLQYATDNQKKTFERKYHKFQRRLNKLEKQQKSTYELQETEIEQIVYNIGMRKESHKIQGSYWESMQKLYRVRTDVLTKTEAETVNQQIDAEFSVEELKSVLGLNNETLQQEYQAIQEIKA